MRLRAGVVLLGLLVTACVGVPDETVHPGPSAPPIPPLGAEASQTSTTAGATGDASGPEPTDVRIAGGLPDGTPFGVSFDHEVRRFPDRISAGIVIDVDGSPMDVGPLDFDFNAGQGHAYEDGVYVVAANGGSGVITINFYDHILEELGSDREQIITSSIQGSSFQGFPALQLRSPFRWASDDELPVNMEISFSIYAVRRGCGEMALACNPTGTIQVVAIDPGDGTEPNWDEIEVSVDSNT